MNKSYKNIEMLIIKKKKYKCKECSYSSFNKNEFLDHLLQHKKSRYCLMCSYF